MKPELANQSVRPGELALDTDEDTGQLVLVIAVPDQTAKEYIIFETPAGDRDITVHRYTNCDPDEAVYEAVYVDDLEEEFGGWDADDIVNRHEADRLENVKVYAFPESRIKSAKKQ